MLAIVGVLVTSYASRRRAPVPGVVAGFLLLAALIGIGQPVMRANDGLLIEPARAYMAIALILAVAGVASVRALAMRRVGLVVASSLLALFGGHAGVVLGALLMSTASLALIAWTSRPVTLHAAIPERVATILLLAADVLVGVALVIEGTGFFEPLKVESSMASALLGVSVCIRLGSGLSIRDPLTVLAVAAPSIAVVTWIPDPSGMTLAVAPLAAWAAWRASRGSQPSSGVLGWTVIAVSMAAVGSTSALLLVPFLMLIAVVWATLADISPGLLLLSVAAPGAAGFTLAASVGDRLADEGSIVAIASLMAAIALLSISTFRMHRPVLVVSEVGRRLVTLVSVAALSVTAILPDRVLRTIARPIAELREPGRLASIEVSPSLGSVAIIAIAILWVLFERGPMKVLLPVTSDVDPIALEVARPDMGEPPALVWQRAVIASFALAAALTIVVLGLSASRGWL